MFLLKFCSSFYYLPPTLLTPVCFRDRRGLLINRTQLWDFRTFECSLSGQQAESVVQQFDCQHYPYRWMSAPSTSNWSLPSTGSALFFHQVEADTNQFPPQSTHILYFSAQSLPTTALFQRLSRQFNWLTPPPFHLRSAPSTHHFLPTVSKGVQPAPCPYPLPPAACPSPPWPP